MLGSCSRRCRRPAQGGGARRGGGVGVALPVDAVVCCGEDVVDLSKRNDGLVEVHAERGEVVDRGPWHGPLRTDGEDSEAVRKVPLPLVVGRGRHDPGEDWHVWVWGVGVSELVLITLLAYLAPQVGLVQEGELDGRDLAGGAVYEERVGSQEGGLVWNGRDGAERVLFLVAFAMLHLFW